MKIEKTPRGFNIAHFNDYYGEKCSIQKSSLITPAIWLGVDDAKPAILASKASQHGISTTEETGWIPYPIHDDVNLTTRMHLDQETAAMLIPLLQRFVNTGDI